MSLFRYTVKGTNQLGKNIYVDRSISGKDAETVADMLSKSYSGATVVIYVECIRLSSDDEECLNVGVDMG